MDASGTGCRFQTTSWTLILRAPSNKADLELFLARYRDPVYAYLRRKGYSPHEADDFTQSFLCSKIVESDWLSKADQSRGRFRSFLLRSLQNYLIDRARQSPDPSEDAVTDDGVWQSIEPQVQEDPHTAFDRQWAATLLHNAIKDVEESCLADGMQVQWTVFEEQVLRPARDGCAATPVDELVRRFQLPSRQKIYSMLQTIERKIARVLREQVAATVDDPADIDCELQEINRLLRS